MKKKEKGQLLLMFLFLLGITSFLMIAFIKIQGLNTKEYQLLEDGYRMDILLEMASQNIRHRISFKEETMTYPEIIHFNNGDVEVHWEEKSQKFQLKARLKNGHSKEDTLYLQFVQ